MKKSQRRFISIYFTDISLKERKKRDVTIALDINSALYEKCKNMKSSEIKEVIKLSSYRDLACKAKKTNRSLGNYIKNKLSAKLL